MSAIFCIAPYTPSTWAGSDYSYTESIGDFFIDVKQYQAQMKSRWAEVEIRPPANDQFSFEWTLPPSRPGFSGLQGKLSTSRQVVTFGSGPKESFLDFILWHRGFVAPEYELYLFGSGYNDVCLLRHMFLQKTWWIIQGSLIRCAAKS